MMHVDGDDRLGNYGNVFEDAITCRLDNGCAANWSILEHGARGEKMVQPGRKMVHKPQTGERERKAAFNPARYRLFATMKA